MKRVASGLLCGLLLLTGCKPTNNDNTAPSDTKITTEKATEAPTEPPIEREPMEASGVMPVIRIDSKDNPDSTDFVSEPVKRSIAESIASWTPGYRIPPEPYYETCTVTITNESGDTLLDGAEANVKVRGNWTTTYDKKPLRLKFTEKQNLLGMNNGAMMKNWLLLAEYKDASMLRNKTALTIAEELLADDGLYVSDAEFVEVFVNNEYWGVYLLAEQQQINPDRVNITEAEVGYKGTDIGYFLEFDGYYDEEAPIQSFSMDYADNAPLTPFRGDEETDDSVQPLNKGGRDIKENTGITIKSDIYSQEQHDFIEAFTNNVYRIMYYAAYEDMAYVFSEDYSEISESTDLSPQEAVEAVVNTESLADAYILNEIACDADIYWSSFFMSVDFGENGDKKLRFEAPWDFDSALGNKNRCSNGEGFYAANIVPDVNTQYQTINPWLAVLMHEEWFRDIIRENWTEAYDSGVFERASDMVNDDWTKYEKAFLQNEERWDSLHGNTAKDEWAREVRRCGTLEEMKDHLSYWLDTRVEFLNGYWHE